MEGIESPQITCHAMITRLDEIKNTLKKDLCTHSVAESKYIYEHIKSGLQDSFMLDKLKRKKMSIAEKLRNFFHKNYGFFILNPLSQLVSHIQPVFVY